MQIHHALELVDDYSLIGIHTSEEDYKLAYLLNLNLHTKFCRFKHNLDFENKNASFSIFEFVDDKNLLDNYLISNKFIGNTVIDSRLSLFPKNESFSSTCYLISEKKSVDYFLKIEGDISTTKLQQTIEKLNSIHQVITSYCIDPSELKSKDFLIF